MRPARALAVLVLCGLAAAGVVWERGEPLASAPTIPVPTRLAPPPPSTQPPTTAPPVSTTTTEPEHRPADPLWVVEEALTAWGRFGVTGDLEEVAPWFITEGPQYQTFVEEAAVISARPPGPPPYTVTASEVKVEKTDGEIRVSARVVFIRTGEPSQVFRWVIVLRRRADGWRVWTVEDSS